MNNSPRILLVRLSAIGDAVHGLPVACVLRRRFPSAFIGWIVEGRTAEILQGHEALDKIISVPRGWLKKPDEILRARREMRDCGFEVALDLQGLTKSALAAWLSGAKKIVGFAGADAREFSRFFYTEKIPPVAVHVVDRNLELLRALGVEQITPEEIRFALPRNQSAKTKVEAWLEDNNFSDSFAALNPGAGWVSKLWPPERYAEVASYLFQKHKLRSVIAWAGAEEQGWAKEIAAASPEASVVALPTSLPELIALLRQARIFVGSDTGPLHLAAAVGVPCVGMYGPVPAERNGPYGAQHVALQKMRVEGGSRKRRNAPPDAMLAITASDVCEACDRILTDETKSEC